MWPASQAFGYTVLYALCVSHGYSLPCTSLALITNSQNPIHLPKHSKNSTSSTQPPLKPLNTHDFLSAQLLTPICSLLWHFYIFALSINFPLRGGKKLLIVTGDKIRLIRKYFSKFVFEKQMSLLEEVSSLSLTLSREPSYKNQMLCPRTTMVVPAIFYASKPGKSATM